MVVAVPAHGSAAGARTSTVREVAGERDDGIGVRCSVLLFSVCGGRVCRPHGHARAHRCHLSLRQRARLKGYINKRREKRRV